MRSVWCASEKCDILFGMEDELIYGDETFAIRAAVFEVYKVLGNGHLEEVYQNALEEELKLRKIPFDAKKQLHVFYKNRDCGLYVPDVICYDKIILELKSVDALHDRHKAQLLNYLRATGYRLGLLVNFNAYPKVEIRRVAL